MKTLAISAAALVLVGAAFAADTPQHYPIFTPGNFTSIMQLLGPNFNAVNDALSKQDFDNAKAHLVRSRELLATSITFWRDRNKEDAIKALRDSLAMMDKLDDILSADKIDAAAAVAAGKAIGAGCVSCHRTYRDQDPATKKFTFKPGLVQ
jgi:hypothetical protein